MMYIVVYDNKHKFTIFDSAELPEEVQFDGDAKDDIFTYISDILKEHPTSIFDENRSIYIGNIRCVKDDVVKYVFGSIYKHYNLVPDVDKFTYGIRVVVDPKEPYGIHIKHNIIATLKPKYYYGDCYETERRFISKKCLPQRNIPDAEYKSYIEDEYTVEKILTEVFNRIKESNDRIDYNDAKNNCIVF